MIWISIGNRTMVNSILKQCGMQTFLVVIDGLAALSHDILEIALDLLLRIGGIVVCTSVVVCHNWKC